MSKSMFLRWVLIGSGMLFAVGLGGCNLSSLTGLLPVALIGALLGSGSGNGT